LLLLRSPFSLPIYVSPYLPRSRCPPFPSPLSLPFSLPILSPSTYSLFTILLLPPVYDIFLSLPCLPFSLPSLTHLLPVPLTPLPLHPPSPYTLPLLIPRIPGQQRRQSRRPEAVPPSGGNRTRGPSTRQPVKNGLKISFKPADLNKTTDKSVALQVG
jgi:hypothetical protein